jgi:hypothetical protein
LPCSGGAIVKQSGEGARPRRPESIRTEVRFSTVARRYGFLGKTPTRKFNAKPAKNGNLD